MKIVTKEMGRPFHTMNIWLIPLLVFAWQKSLGVIRADREWIWWVMLPIIFGLWFAFNFKFIKRNR